MDLQFLDLHDLTDKDKHEILTILRSETTSTLKLPWDATENNNSNVNSAIVTEVPAFHQQHWYNGKCAAYIFDFFSDFFLYNIK